MDEADRMIDMGFEEDVRSIMSHFKVGIFISLLGLPLFPFDESNFRHESGDTARSLRSLAAVSTPNPPLFRHHAP